jgi:hypothetical protein
VETQALDNVFAFSPPPIVDSFAATDPSSPLSDRSSRTPLPSEHVTSLLEISPASRPFGTPGPTYYPKTPNAASSLAQCTVKGHSSTFIASHETPSLHLTCPDSNETDITLSGKSDISAGPVDDASVTVDFSYDPPPNYSGPIDETDDRDAFEANICDVDIIRLALPDAAQGRCTLPSSKRPYLESPTDPPDIDVDFRFARVPHSAVHASDRPTSSFLGSIGMSTTESPSHFHLGGTRDFHRHAPQPLMMSIELAAEETQTNSVELGSTNSTSRKAFADSLIRNRDVNRIAQDLLSSKLFTHTSQLPHFGPPMECRGSQNFGVNQSDSARLTPVSDDTNRQPHINITNQHSTPLDLSGRSAPFHTVCGYPSVEINRAEATQDLRNQVEHSRGQNEEQALHSAALNKDDWQRVNDSDMEHRTPCILSDHVSGVTTAASISYRKPLFIME